MSTTKKFDQFFLTGVSAGSKGALKIEVATDNHETKHKLLKPSDEVKQLLADFKNAVISFLFPHTVTDQNFRDSPYIGISQYKISEREAACARMDLTFHYLQFIEHLHYNSAEINMSGIQILPPEEEEQEIESDDTEEEKARKQGNRVRYKEMYKALRALNDYVEENYEAILETPQYQQSLFPENVL